ncbi:TRIM71 [Symbiodinium natans]|uniref:TRIM71 protein n=1 Tax=Symbiodinium natans TaxID=878477 RepID=A0A812KZD1_9DINO|nr:TRIM71 [Symbiodinium natans]
MSGRSTKIPDGKVAEIQHVPKTEERGIALRQLKALLAFVHASATEGQLPWKRRDGAWIQPSKINLYDCTAWVIKPATRHAQCSYVELVTEDPVSQKPKWFVSHAWSEPVSTFALCLEQHGRLRDLEDKAGAGKAHESEAKTRRQHQGY